MENTLQSINLYFVLRVELEIQNERSIVKGYGALGIHSLITSNLVDSERERSQPYIKPSLIGVNLRNLVIVCVLLPFLCSVLALFSGLKLIHLLYFSASCSWCLIGTSLSIKGDVMRLKFLHRNFQNNL